MSASRDRTAGLTLVEIMVTVAVLGIVCGFAFSVQLRVSAALRDQTAVADAQQTLRAASELIVRDLRMAGSGAASVGYVGGSLGAITVRNGTSGPDKLTVLYAEATPVAVVLVDGNGGDSYKTSGGTLVSATTGFAADQLVLATHMASTTPEALNLGCLLKTTSVNGARIVTDPAAGTPWNQTGNSHCDGMATIWNDGYTAFVKPVLRTYRIKPDDARGILQVSPSAEVIADDWQDVAAGLVDLQVALRVYVKDDLADEDGDGDPLREWYSGDNMSALPATGQIAAVSVTLLAKTTREVSGVSATTTPDLTETRKAADWNRVGDVAGKELPVLSQTSPYHGENIYRTYTATVGLRNTSVRN